MAPLVLLAALAAPFGTGDCFAAAGDIAAGAAIASRDVTAVACRPGQPRPALRYDRTNRALTATAPIAAGTYLGRLAALPQHMLSAGAELVLRSSSGPVTIRRRVTAVQPGRSGGHLFVRDSEGHVFAAVLEIEEAR